MKTERTLFDVIGSLAHSFSRTDKRQAELINALEKAVNQHTETILKPLAAEASALCYAIEKLPSGEQQTAVSLMASNLCAKLSKPPNLEPPRPIEPETKWKKVP